MTFKKPLPLDVWMLVAALLLVAAGLAPAWGQEASGVRVPTAEELAGLVERFEREAVELRSDLAALEARVDQVLEGAPVEPGDDEDPPPAVEPDPEPVASGPVLRPGDGFDGPAIAPSQAGDPEAPGGGRIAIARWDVVPEQVFEGQFAVGVVAHHIYGIDYVGLQVEGGPSVRVDQSSINPRTQVDEYWATLDANDFADGKIEVRAVAYPENGAPRVLPPLYLFANRGGSIEHPVLELPAGRHRLFARPLPQEGWLIVRPAPGVSRDECVIFGHSRWWKDGSLKLENLTYEPGPGNGPMLGSFNRNKPRDQVWMDRVRIVGNGERNPTNWVTQAFSHQYFTDVEFTKVRKALHHGPVMARNIRAVEVYEDFANANGLYANIEVVGLDRRSLVRAHPDLFQFPKNIPNNLIVQDLVAEGINAQGLFADAMTDCAFVRLEVSSQSPFQALHLLGPVENMLIEDSTFSNGQFRSDKWFKADGLVLRGTRVGAGLPGGWDLPGVVVANIKEGQQK